MKPQTCAVLNRLALGPLTHQDALRELGVARLAARVCELKAADYPVVRHLIRVPTRGGDARVALYRLEVR